jgi:oligosaccharide 4-alpha-D-glucosyltransferase
MKNIIATILLSVLILPLVFSQGKHGFVCEMVNESTIKIKYISTDPNHQFLASDAVVLPSDGECSMCQVETDRIYIPFIDLTVLARPDGKGFITTLQDDEEIYGGGGRALPVNRRGYAFPLDNHPWYGYGYGADHLNFSVPFFISSKGYGLFFNNPSKGHADIGKTNKNIFDIKCTGGALELYIMLGNISQVLASYHNLTGHQEMLPKWSMGLFLSRFGYISEKNVQQIARKMDKKGFPYDAIIFDLFWFGDSIKSTMGNLDWVNKKAWPDPKKMIAGFTKNDRKTILITEPFVLATSLEYKNSKPFLSTNVNGEPYQLPHFYFGKGGLIDIFRKDSKDWFLTKYQKQMDIGVAGWWGDLGEPESHPEDLCHNLSDIGGHPLTPSGVVHNLYGHEWTKMLYQYYREKDPHYKLFNLNRAGFAGSQRYGIIPWTGDVSRSWDGLKAQLPLLSGMALSGIPYIHSDAGGFAGGEKDPELYTRWFQFSVFTPILRPHGTAVYEIDPGAVSYPSEPALIGKEWESVLRKYSHLRYEMLPYNYNLSFRHFRYGTPLMAPMIYYFPDDKEGKKYENQFFWGKDMLVASVLEKGKKRLELYLPEIHQWYSFQSSSNPQKLVKMSGKQTLDIGINHLPVFVKEGSFIVLTGNKKGKTTKDYDSDNIEIHYYFCPENSESEWYDDKGDDRLAFSSGQYDLLQFNAIHEREKSKIKIVTVNKKDPGYRKERTISLFVHGFNSEPEIYCNGKNLPASKNGGYKIHFNRNQEYTLELVKKD